MRKVRLSHHAERRAAQRNICPDDIHFVIDHAQFEHRTGVVFAQLRQKNLPASVKPNSRLYQLVGTTVILCQCKQYVITVYRDPAAFKRDRRKHKYNSKSETKSCPFCQTIH